MDRERHSRVIELRQQSAGATAKLSRPYAAIGDALMSIADAGLKDRMAELAAIRDEADRAEAAIEKLGPIITSAGLKKFAEAAKQRMRADDGTYRRAHIRAVARCVEVLSTTEIRIMVSKNRTASDTCRRRRRAGCDLWSS